MADIFVSYQKADRALAQRVVAALSHAGYSVWWDDRLTPAENWDRMIEREIARAKCVLVLWTARSVESEWVRIEANVAKNARPAKLVQVRLEECEVPIAFSLTQFADLFERRFDASAPGWAKALEWVALYAGPGRPAMGEVLGAAAPVSPPPARGALRPTVAAQQWPPYAAGAVLALMVGGLRAYASTGGPGRVDITASDRSGMFIAATIAFFLSIAAFLWLSRRLDWGRAVIFAGASYGLAFALARIVAEPLHRYLLHDMHVAPSGIRFVLLDLAVSALAAVGWALLAALLGAFSGHRDLRGPIVLGVAGVLWSIILAQQFNGVFVEAMAAFAVASFLDIAFVLALFPPRGETRRSAAH